MHGRAIENQSLLLLIITSAVNYHQSLSVTSTLVMASSKRTESDLTSVSSGLSTAPDEPTTNGKPKTTKAKSTKSAPVKKAKAQSASTASTKKAVTVKNGTAKDSGRPVKDMSKAKPNGKGKGKAVVEEVEKIEKRQRTYGLLSEDQIDYQEDEDIKSE